MDQSHKTSFLISLVFIFLLPIFFIPGGALFLDNAKATLLTFGITIITLTFLLEIWRRGELNIPRHLFILVVVLLPLVYLLSALLSTPSALSLFGYDFEVGTFGYMLIGSMLLLLTSIIFTHSSRVFQALVAFFIAFSLIALLTTIKIFSGGVPIWGTFFGNMGNPIGNWTDLAISFGLLSIFVTLVIGMIPMKPMVRALVYLVFALSTALLVIVNFPVALILTLGASVLIFCYFLKMEKHFFLSDPAQQIGTSFFTRPTFLPIVLGIISLVFLINPTLSETQGTLGTVIAKTFKVENTDVRPSFSATLSVSKAVLSNGAFLGSGPNTFSHDWLIYKPVNVNTTPFWAVAFPFGIGFIPTQIASTGILGITLWLVFFVLFILLIVKALSNIPESRAERFNLIVTLFAAFFLWTASFLYAPSETVLILAFIFSGLFIATLREAKILSSRSFNLKEFPQTRFISTLLIVVIVLGVGFIGWIGVKRTASAYHFKKAIDLSNTSTVSLDTIEVQLNKALKSAPADIYYVALSRINFVRAQEAANNTTDTPEKNRAVFEESFSKSIEAARTAVSLNPAGYQNWVALGIIYSSLVPEPLKIAGAYENASFAFAEALKRNPTNPELSLLSARLELNKGDLDAARSMIRQSLALKEDYVDAYLMLAQLEVQEGNTAEAIASAEKLAILRPNNPGLYFELGLLKYSNKDYDGAVAVFKMALESVPNYANAQYYLGLSLAYLGLLAEAQEQFEALATTNPDNQEVKLILEDLRVGKSEFLNKLAK